MKRQAVVDERAGRLAQAEALRALRADREAAVRSWQTYEGGASLHRPEPSHAERLHARPGRWLATSAAGEESIRCGLDDAGEVVIALGPLGGGEDEHLLSRMPGYEEIVIRYWNDDVRYVFDVLHIYRDPSDRVVETFNSSGRHESYLYTDEGRLSRIDITDRERFPVPVAHHDFSYGEQGLARVEFESDVYARVVWDAARDAVVEDLPPLDELAAHLPRELPRVYADAIIAAAAQLPDPLVAVIRLFRDGFPMPGVVIDRQAVIEACADGLDIEAVLDSALDLSQFPNAKRRLDPIAHAAPDAQRSMRALNQNAEEAGGWSAISDIVADLAVAVIEQLNGRPDLGLPPVVLWSSRDSGWSMLQQRFDQLRQLGDSDQRWLPTLATAGPDVIAQLRVASAHGRDRTAHT